jgi:hypothetical protein
LEAPLGIAHVELDEGAGQLLHLPRRAGLAGAQPDHHVADPNRLPGLELEVARDAVALVEQPKHRDALRHRSGAGRDRGHRLRNVDRLRLGLVGAIPLIAFPAASAGGKAEEAGERGGSSGSRFHPSPGVQAS